MVYIGAIIAAALIITIAVFYALNNLNKRGKNCKRLKQSAPLQNITKEDVQYDNPLRDFIVKSSYNSCASGGYKNDWVDLCALTHAIKEGCRLLDFEVYDVEGIPVIAVSSSKEFTLKQSYNYLSLDKVLKCIEDNAFSGDVNGMDPLFLNFRIKSDHVEICNGVASALIAQPTLASRLLGPDYSYEYQGHNFGMIPLKTLCQKVIVMASENLAPSPLFRILGFNELASQDLTELTEFSKIRLLMVRPISSDNYTSASTVTLGAQFSAMNMQTLDKNLIAYTDEFVKNGNRAFYLKKDRYVQTEIPDAKPLSEDSTFGTTNYKNKYFDFTL